ncbi:MAG: ClpXP protease specificity-enhancing factor [Proteobacteria bacterium]|nr:ClpXP protease specificity-enhancing factor [Pseudomonadota bacterium]
MSVTPLSPPGSTSTKPYLIRALHDWCTDNGYTPYLAVFVDAQVQVPLEYVKNSEIVLNVGFEATGSLVLGNEYVEFKARFGGVVRDIVVPVDHVLAIYARENGQGMAFPPPSSEGADVGTPIGVGAGVGAPARSGGLRLATEDGSTAAPAPSVTPKAPDDEPPPPRPPAGTRPTLKRVK